MNQLNLWLTRAYLNVTGFFHDLKEDQRGLSGVVVAVLLILIAVLAVSAIWAALSGQLGVWWSQIIGESYDKPILNAPK